MKKGNTIVVALDIGSTKILVAVASCTDSQIEILGVGQSESKGVRQDQIVHMAQAQEAIRKAKEEAELASGFPISQVYLSVGSWGSRSIQSHGLIPIKNKEIQNSDIRRVLDVAQSIRIPEDSRILHPLAQSYTVDGLGGIDSPLSMKGVRLEVKAQLVTISEENLNPILSCVQKAGLSVKRVVLNPYGCSLAVTNGDERELGVALVDIGGGTCQMLCYNQGALTHVDCVPVGGSHFSQDVAMGLKTPLMSAERLKKQYGTAMVDLVDQEETIDVPGLGERNLRSIQRGELSRILEARSEETLSLIFQKINQWDVLGNLAAGVVFTGGGSLLPGLVDLAKLTFDVPVRLGSPKRDLGIHETYRGPTYSAVVGALIFGFQQESSWQKGLGQILGEKTERVLEKGQSFLEEKNLWKPIRNLFDKTLSI